MELAVVGGRGGTAVGGPGTEVVAGEDGTDVDGTDVDAGGTVVVDRGAEVGRRPGDGGVPPGHER